MAVLMIVLSVLLACLLDRLLGEARRWHPLVGFGRYAKLIECCFNTGPWRRLRGVLAWSLAVLPFVALYCFYHLLLQPPVWVDVLVDGFILYLALGWKSLLQHAKAIAEPLLRGNLPDARAALSQIVSRDTDSLDESGIATAATESVLENGSDAVFAPLFWFLLAGAPGVLLYRLSNTLDAMWGYKTPRYLHFGWCAARMDDVLNFLPARLTALSYALMGCWETAIRCWKEQAKGWKSPNAGPVMASGAGALQVKLGGEACYEGRVESRPVLGLDAAATAQVGTITAAAGLVTRVLCLWLVLISFAGLLIWVGSLLA